MNYMAVTSPFFLVNMVSISESEDFMSKESLDVREKISELVREYGNEQMSIRPKAISVDVHSQSVVVILEGVLHPAEINMAKERFSRDLIERMYAELFNVSKPILQSRMERLLHRSIDRSFFAVEPQFGNAVIVFFLSGGQQYPKIVKQVDALVNT